MSLVDIIHQRPYKECRPVKSSDERLKKADEVVRMLHDTLDRLLNEYGAIEGNQQHANVIEHITDILQCQDALEYAEERYRQLYMAMEGIADESDNIGNRKEVNNNFVVSGLADAAETFYK